MTLSHAPHGLLPLLQGCIWRHKGQDTILGISFIALVLSEPERSRASAHRKKNEMVIQLNSQMTRYMYMSRQTEGRKKKKKKKKKADESAFQPRSFHCTFASTINGDARRAYIFSTQSHSKLQSIGTTFYIDGEKGPNVAQRDEAFP